MPLYNHEAFVAEAVNSVLQQSESDFELIVVDDCSADGSAAVVEAISDPRVRFFRNARNKGACLTMNRALAEARGDFIAVCNSDDVWEPEKLALQLEMLGAMPDAVAVFSDVDWIDDAGKRLSGEELPAFAGVFRQPNRSRFVWLRHLAEEGNCLCHPSVLIRRDVFAQVGVYDNRYRQLPDYDMWLRVLSVGEIYVSPLKLVRFRVHANNTSHQGNENRSRTLREHVLIARSFFLGLNYDTFVRAFGVGALGSLNAGGDRAAQLNEMIDYLTSVRCPLEDVLHEAGFELAFLRPGLGVGGGDLAALDLRLQQLAASKRGIPQLYGGVGIAPRPVERMPSSFGLRIYDYLRGLNRARRHRRKQKRRG